MLMDTGLNDLYDALVADEMGIGKAIVLSSVRGIPC